MPLRRRLAWVVALVALAVVVLAGTAAWLTTRSVLRDNVDDALRAQAMAVERERPRSGGMFIPAPDGSGRLLRLPAPPARQGGPTEYAQTLAADGSIVTTRGDLTLPVTNEDVVAIETGRTLGPRDVHVGDAHLRMMTVPLTGETALRFDAVALQFARPMNGVDSALRTLWLVLLLVGVVTVAIAAALGRTAARRVLRPVGDLAEAAAHVEATADLDRRIPVQSSDELGELTRRFNGMLQRLQGSRAELDRSIAEQRNLVADASHELRTPVTSLRMNAEILLEDEDALTADERRTILEDVRDQAEDLGDLVSDLIELARGDEPDPGADEPVELDALVRECVARAQRDHRGVEFHVDLVGATVVGRPDRLARAVGNLLNNAALHGSDGSGSVEVAMVHVVPDTAVEIQIVDHGPGVPVSERERIFDRFRRGNHSRTRHGSGLGLAIVRQVASVHRGTVRLDETLGGGATFMLRLPTVENDRLGDDCVAASDEWSTSGVNPVWDAASPDGLGDDPR